MHRPGASVGYPAKCFIKRPKSQRHIRGPVSGGQYPGAYTNPIKYLCLWEAHVLLSVGRYDEIDARGSSMVRIIQGKLSGDFIPEFFPQHQTPIADERIIPLQGRYRMSDN
jgi:hypothetical protein